MTILLSEAKELLSQCHREEILNDDNSGDVEVFWTKDTSHVVYTVALGYFNSTRTHVCFLAKDGSTLAVFNGPQALDLRYRGTPVAVYKSTPPEEIIKEEIESGGIRRNLFKQGGSTDF